MFTVIWRASALDAFAEAYVRAGPADKGRLAQAVEAFNARVAGDPLKEGESRDEGVRIAFDRPLAFQFCVLEADRLVYVTHFKIY